MARLDDFGYTPPVYWRERPPGLEGFGARLRVRREGANMTREALAELTQLSASHVASIEYGRQKPSYRASLMLAAALGVDAHWLISGEGQP